MCKRSKWAKQFLHVVNLKQSSLNSNILANRIAAQYLAKTAVFAYHYTLGLEPEFLQNQPSTLNSGSSLQCRV